MARSDYAGKYLQSEHWRELRNAVVEERGGRCERCGSTARLVVHHKTYDRVGHEHPRDLEVLCRDCHVVRHPHLIVEEADPRWSDYAEPNSPLEYVLEEWPENVWETADPA